MRNNNYTIVFIGGAGRSGSTLLEILLGGRKSATCVGELREFFDYAQDPNMPCGCGELISHCSFWQKVSSSLIAQGLDLKEIGALSKRLTKSRNVWKLKFSFMRRRNPEWKRLVGATQMLYDTVAEVSGAEYIIDSSKSAMQVAILKEFNNKERLKVLHQIRDSRGVAYSWSKNAKLIQTHAGLVSFPRRSYYMAGFRWMIENAAIEFISRGLDYARIRYEELTEHPRQCVEKALEQMNLTVGTFDVRVSPDKIISAPAGVTHSVGGNPMRSYSDGASISYDAKWKNELSNIEKLSLGLLTYPSLKRYSYKL